MENSTSSVFRVIPRLNIVGDLNALISGARTAVDSFSPGHWTLMQELEHRACDVVRNQETVPFIDFLCDTAFLKQPYRVNREGVRRTLVRYPTELTRSLTALQRADVLDYRAMDCLAELPWFGRGGGRAFNSAVFRLVSPRRFGIIDWRNLAVITGAPGFTGLLEPPLHFADFSPSELLDRKGTLPFTKRIYERYNDALRQLADNHQKTAAEMDLAIWVYSIQKCPFGYLPRPQTRKDFRISSGDREALRRNHETVAKRIMSDHLDRLKDFGYLRKDLLVSELCAVFALVRDECEVFGRQKRGSLRQKVRQVVRSLDKAIETEDRYRLLSQWDRWANLVDTTSADWKGISLPATMVLDGYLVFEDFEPVRRYFADLYDPESLEPRKSYD
jgi:hypothetical protein